MNMNVLGTPLEVCGIDPPTGYTREGVCKTGPDDSGKHVVCVKVTREFLEFSMEKGNDLITPAELANFPGLQPGDNWCICLSRWKEALDYGIAPPVILRATHKAALELVSLEDLLCHSLGDNYC